MQIKAVLSDYDGTLISHGGEYHPDTPRLIKKIQHKGVTFAVATGRACFGEVSKIIEELDLSEFNIVNGGSMIINWKTREAALHKPISQKSVEEIVSYLSSLHVVFSLETKDDAFMLAIVDTHAYMDKSVIKLFTANEIPADVLKILLHGFANKLPEITVDYHIKHIATMCKDVEVIKFMGGSYYGLDVTSQESTKHTAVLEYAKLHGISPHEIVAIGDGYNDYPLFTACGYKIAMGNAPKELKDIADLIVPTAEEGGMKIALEHILSLL
jgi:5-amino-6-(5-phospho-D-ribitylamino)uracil phosphatase